jgi:hypothetical protein
LRKTSSVKEFVDLALRRLSKREQSWIRDLAESLCGSETEEIARKLFSSSDAGGGLVGLPTVVGIGQSTE